MSSNEEWDWDFWRLPFQRRFEDHEYYSQIHTYALSVSIQSEFFNPVIECNDYHYYNENARSQITDLFAACTAFWLEELPLLEGKSGFLFEEELRTNLKVKAVEDPDLYRLLLSQKLANLIYYVLKDAGVQFDSKPYSANVGPKSSFSYMYIPISGAKYSTSMSGFRYGPSVLVDFDQAKATLDSGFRRKMTLQISKLLDPQYQSMLVSFVKHAGIPETSNGFPTIRTPRTKRFTTC